MYLERLELLDFRCYQHADLHFPPGVTVFVGANAQGKTSLLEAVHYLAIGGSPRVASDQALVRIGSDHAVIKAAVRHGDDRPLLVDLEIRPGGRSRARLNGQEQTRLRDAIGAVRSVMFSPGDLELVNGEPAVRRGFLDELLAQRRPAYEAAKQEYDRILRQRNTLLRKSRATGRPAGPSLEVWTEQLVAAGAVLLAARIALVHALSGPTREAWADLTRDAPGGADDRPARLVYEVSTGRSVAGEPGVGVPDPAALAAELRAGLDTLATEEQDRGVTLAGPHRDELRLALGALPAKGYASHGEAWSLALALRLASLEVLAEIGEPPLVLLDDVFAELDELRREQLADRCRGYRQVLITAAVDADVPLEGPRHLVEAGRVGPQLARSVRSAGGS